MADITCPSKPSLFTWYLFVIRTRSSIWKVLVLAMVWWCCLCLYVNQVTLSLCYTRADYWVISLSVSWVCVRCTVRSRSLDVNSSIELLFITISGLNIHIIIAYSICLYYFNTVVITVVLVNNITGWCHCVLNQSINIIYVISIYLRVVILRFKL